MDIELTCPRCHETSVPDTKELTFKNGTHHTEARCSRCGAWIKYLEHNPDRKVEDTPLHFGKYKGKTLKWIAMNDLDYLHWLYGVIKKKSLKEKIDQVLSNM